MISIRKVKFEKNFGKSGNFSDGMVSRHHPFQLSKKMDYGLFLMIELAKLEQSSTHGSPFSLRNIANQNHMSFFFLQKVAFNLRQAGLIEASRGKNGGYILKKDPDFITLKEILEALEGPVAIMHCLDHSPNTLSCIRENQCSMRGGIEFLNQMLLNILAQTSLTQLLYPTWQSKL